MSVVTSVVITIPPPPAYGFSIAANDVVKTEGNAGGTDYTFTVTRFGDLSTAGSIFWTTLNGNSAGTATNVTNGADFAGTRSGTLDFAPGQVSQTITVTATGDTIAETDELFTVALSGQAGFTSAPLPPDWADRVTATILNDDATVGATYSLGWGSGDSLGPVGTAEQTGGTDFIITRSGDVSVAGSVDWQVAGSGVVPATGADFTGGALPGGTAQFAAGEITKTIHLAVLNDYVQEPTEGFQILLSNPSAGTGLDVGQMDGQIFDDDAAAGFAIVANAASVVEGQPGTITPYTFTVYRSGDSSAAASVDWSAGYGYVLGVPGSAAGGDFASATNPAGTVVFAPGETSQVITVPIRGDLEYELNESFAVNLSNPSNGLPLRVASANGVILNDDTNIPATHIAISATDADKAEGNAGTTPFTFTLTRTGDLTYGGTVGWSVSLPTPASGFAPFLAPGFVRQGTASFIAGQATQLITIEVAGDAIPEPDQNFTVSITAVPAGSDIVANQGSATGTIRNDDGPAQPSVFSIAASDTSKSEGNSGITEFSFVISRTGGTDVAAQIGWFMEDGAFIGNPDVANFNDIVPLVIGSSAAAGSFFSTPAGILTFAAGEVAKNITIQVVGDTQFEADEQLRVSLYQPSFGSTIATASATSIILNDDGPPPPPAADYTGTSGNDTVSFAGSSSDKILDLSQGGNDTATGGNGGDEFRLGGALNATDKINGGTGPNALFLDGDYSAGVVFGSTTVTNIYSVTLTSGHSYNLTTNDATVASGATMVFDASALAAINSATINGTAEKNGNFIFLGGTGNDVFTGGRGADSFLGGLGADRQTGGLGADIFHYGAVADSALQTSGGAIDVSGDDTLVSFLAGTDKIDLISLGFSGASASVLTKTSTAFSTTLANGTGFFGTAGVAVEYAKSGKTTNARIYADTNHDGNLNAGDMLIQLTGVSKNSIGASSFNF